MSASNPWDSLTGYFDSSRPEVASGAADNVLIAWPVLLRFLTEHAPPAGRALDYGCGGGGFAQQLSALGLHVVGVDSSPSMIATARRAHPALDFHVADAASVHALGQFDVVTSIMVFQFVDDIAATMRDLARVLRPGGALVCATFNPAYVVERIAAQRTFHGFDSSDHPTAGVIELGQGIQVPTFIRTARDYNQLAQRAGLAPVLEDYPPFTPEFLKQYPRSVPTQNGEYLILGYTKQR